jgi:hypothetical protein
VDVDGVETNVSLARFKRLFKLVAEALEEPAVRATSQVLPLLLRFLWETARDKADLLDFLDTLNRYTPIFAVDGPWGNVAHRLAS